MGNFRKFQWVHGKIDLKSGGCRYPQQAVYPESFSIKLSNKDNKRKSETVKRGNQTYKVSRNQKIIILRNVYTHRKLVDNHFLQSFQFFNPLKFFIEEIFFGLFRNIFERTISQKKQSWRRKITEINM